MTEIVVEEKAGVAWVTLNRPDVRNALSRAVNLKLTDIALELDQRDSVRAIVLTGAGDKAFCAGADLKERKGVPANEALPFINAIASAIETWGEIRKPTIAMLNGSAFGGGLELALACDLRVIVDGAELGLTEVRLGIMPGAGGTQRLPRLVGEARAKELILLGRRITAARAVEIGLVHQMVARDKLKAAVDGLLAELAGCAPISLMSAKSAIQRGYGMPLAEALAIERECYEVTLFSEDRDEGLAAFAEGRPPKYLGR
ncbi:MAG TPA: enoyl-CoA hydratase-related protein [Kofleriaceae bacterium]